MNIETLKGYLPHHAKDMRLNLGIILTEEGSPGLTSGQRYGVALACAYAIRHFTVMHWILEEAKTYLSDQEIEAVQSAAIMMAMNNVYYRFVHLVSDSAYGQMPAKLRMNVIGNPGISKGDFELYCMAVSALNGCGLCMDAHAKELSKNGVTPLGIQSAVRIAAVLNGVVCGVSIRYPHSSQEVIGS